ncbi:hypothetical protein [Streptacidiphilus sp. MAP5-3]|uniref:hypothetical protein n=1 Tax=unclassified Streptacidiphilus TaxID=2643834 RepID=UPI003516F528
MAPRGAEGLAAPPTGREGPAVERCTGAGPGAPAGCEAAFDAEGAGADFPASCRIGGAGTSLFGSGRSASPTLRCTGAAGAAGAAVAGEDAERSMAR